MTSEDDRATLLRLARETIAAHLGHAAAPRPDPAGAGRQPGGAFVSLHHGRDLRGCIGHIEADQPVGRTVARCAIAAATDDPRFPPLTLEELPAITIELSLLGPLQPIEGPDDIEIGRDGLVVEMGWQRGLLLPQVATEWHWDREGFLSHTCQKAGLPRDAWRHGAKLWRFEAEVFSDLANQ